jgi:hypothetical protein
VTTPDHRFITDVPALTDPVLIVMMTGWIDASGAAAAAMATLQSEIDAVALVSFDDDVYIDYRARRPLLELRDGVATRLVWASPEMQYGRAGGGRDVVTLNGPEPDMAWHRFCATIGDLAERLGVRRMVGLGAYPFATPHTRPVVLSATSPSRDVLAQLPFRTNSVDVPAGMAAALEQELHGRGIPSVGVWAQVPHYVASMPYPAASVALLDALTASCAARRGCSVTGWTSWCTATPSTRRWSRSSSGCSTPPTRRSRSPPTSPPSRARRARASWSCAAVTSWPVRSSASCASGATSSGRLGCWRRAAAS